MKHKILYYEVSDSMVDKLGGKYFRHYTRSARPRILAYGSDRIWEWDLETDLVRYVYHRKTGLMTAVEPGEFLLIQLQAEEY
jgi:hypothetical protein